MAVRLVVMAVLAPASRCQSFFRGTLAPLERASDNPIAIACSRLFTVPPFPPGPDFRVPLCMRWMALSTRLLAASPYSRVERVFAAAIVSSRSRVFARRSTRRGDLASIQDPRRDGDLLQL